MLTKRIIPCLDVRDGKLTKGVKFKGNVDIGDPVDMAEFYYLEGADEIVVHRGHRILLGHAGKLGAEELFLQVGIVQLGVSVGDFHPLDEQLEPFGNVRVVATAFR